MAFFHDISNGYWAQIRLYTCLPYRDWFQAITITDGLKIWCVFKWFDVWSEGVCLKNSLTKFDYF